MTHQIQLLCQLIILLALIIALLYYLILVMKFDIEKNGWKEFITLFSVAIILAICLKLVL